MSLWGRGWPWFFSRGRVLALCLHPWEGATSAREQWPHGGQLLGPCCSSKTPPSLPWAPRYNSAKKDNDFIYHEAVPALDTLQPVKGLTLGEAGGQGGGTGA